MSTSVVPPRTGDSSHLLLETAGNRAPSKVRTATVVTSDGVPLRTATWSGAARSRGTILILQGRAEFIEKYFETVGDLLARGYAVAAFDWRGQGGSGRRVADPSKGHIDDFAEYGLDLAAIGRHFERAGWPRPVTVLAHSMGAAVALSAAATGSLPASRLVALAPMIDLKMVKHPRTVRALIRCLAALGLGARFVPGGNGRSISTLAFAGNRLSADPERYARNAETARGIGPAAIGAPTIGWLAAAYRAMAALRASDVAPAIDVPVLLVAAGDDPVCLTPAIERFGQALAGGPAHVIAGARHEILMETDTVRAAFWSLFDAFMAR